MITLIVGIVQIAAAVSPAAPIVWLNEDFELPSYGESEKLYAAWPVDGTFQHAKLVATNKEKRVTAAAGKGRALDQIPVDLGSYLLREEKGNGSRHIRVFDPTNSVNGTDDCPLRFKYLLYINDRLAQGENTVVNTFRYCELINTKTGDRIGLGPALGNAWWQVFDGVQWRNLKSSVGRTVGWTSFEIVIKTSTLQVTIANSAGQTCETVLRLTRSGFGSFALGSGKYNKDVTTFIDNILVDGGIVGPEEGKGPTQQASSRIDAALIQKVHQALQLVGREKAKEGLEALETILQETTAKASAGDQASKAAMPWIYEAIGTAKEVLEASPEELRNVHYEAIAESPNGVGADSVVCRLAANMNGSEKEFFLLNLSKRNSASLAGLEAARILVASPPKEAPSDKNKRFKKEIAEAPDTLVPEAVVEAILAQGSGDDAERCRTGYIADVLADQLVGQEVLSRYSKRLFDLGRRLVEERKWDSLQQLADWVVARRLEGSIPIFRRLLFVGRMAVRDGLGALAAISDKPLGEEKAELLKELAAMDDQVGRIRQLLTELVSRAIEANNLVSPTGTQEPALWDTIARSADDAALPYVAIVAYQVITREAKPVSAIDGMPLADEFALKEADLEQLVDFWQAQSLIARKQLIIAGRILDSLTQSASPVLRAQAAFDLAKVVQRQYRPQCATRPAAICEALLPTSQTVRNLKESIAQQIRSRQELQRLNEEVAQAWAQVQQAKDSKEAASILMSIAEIEMRLGAFDRAAGVLEGLLTKYETAPSLPAALDKLAWIYEKHLNKKEESKSVRARLIKAFPGYIGTQGDVN